MLRTFNQENSKANSARAFVVEVTDTGVGIDAQILPRIFNAFEQGERSITRTFGGLGLGLTIGRTIAEMHGGTLTAASDGINRGATLTLTLPVRVVPVIDAPAPVASNSPSSSVNILVVDDDQPTLRMLSRLLTTMGHKVTTAASAAEAIIIAIRECPELLITDIGMPNQSGWSLLTELRERCTTPFVAIAVSGYGADDDLQRSKDAGFAEHLVKPVDIEQLQKVLDRLMANKG